LHIHAKIPDYRGSLCSLSGIKIHFREFLYNFALKRNKLLAGSRRGSGQQYLLFSASKFPHKPVCFEEKIHR
ncbi:MAG: hypothetical protein LBG25_03440, partial [Spirochaetaceae bacterium]|nr:hypothetical protein [Spirochaetaceae bacterium]